MLFVVTVAGLLLLFSWMQNRGVVALGLWGTGYLLAAAAIMMFGIGNGLADAWAGAYAGAIWSSAHGLMLTAARSFEGRRTPLSAPSRAPRLARGLPVRGFLGSPRRASMLVIARSSAATCLVRGRNLARARPRVDVALAGDGAARAAWVDVPGPHPACRCAAVSRRRAAAERALVSGRHVRDAVPCVLHGGACW